MNGWVGGSMSTPRLAGLITLVFCMQLAFLSRQDLAGLSSGWHCLRELCWVQRPQSQSLNLQVQLGDGVKCPAKQQELFA